MTCSSHSDRRGDSGLLVGQVCRSGQLWPAKTCWHGDVGPWKVLESVTAGRVELLSRTGVGFASSCFFTDMLNASKSQGPRSAQQVWPHTGHLHTHPRTDTHSYTSSCKQTHVCIPAISATKFPKTKHVFAHISYLLSCHNHLMHRTTYKCKIYC